MKKIKGDIGGERGKGCKIGAKGHWRKGEVGKRTNVSGLRDHCVRTTHVDWPRQVVRFKPSSLRNKSFSLVLPPSARGAVAQA